MQADRQNSNNQRFPSNNAANPNNRDNFGNDTQYPQNERNIYSPAVRSPVDNSRSNLWHTDEAQTNHNNSFGRVDQSNTNSDSQSQKPGRFIHDPSNFKRADSVTNKSSSTNDTQKNSSTAYGRDNQPSSDSASPSQKPGRFIHGPSNLKRANTVSDDSFNTDNMQRNLNTECDRNNQRDNDYDPRTKHTEALVNHRYSIDILADVKIKPAIVPVSKTDRDMSFFTDNARKNVSNQVVKSYILWIDERSQDNLYAENQLKSGNDVVIDFCSSFFDGQDHLRQIIDKIRSPSSTFQIICRGYYKNQDKNPLDLLLFLNQNNLQHIPVIVFTRNKDDLENRLKQEAPSKRINDWYERLKIITDVEELTKQCKLNIKNKLNVNAHGKKR